MHKFLEIWMKMLELFILPHFLTSKTISDTHQKRRIFTLTLTVYFVCVCVCAKCALFTYKLFWKCSKLVSKRTKVKWHLVKWKLWSVVFIITSNLQLTKIWFDMPKHFIFTIFDQTKHKHLQLPFSYATALTCKTT